MLTTHNDQFTHKVAYRLDSQILALVRVFRIQHILANRHLQGVGALRQNSIVGRMEY